MKYCISTKNVLKVLAFLSLILNKKMFSGKVGMYAADIYLFKVKNGNPRTTCVKFVES